MSVIKTDLLQNRLGTSHPAVTKADFVKAWDQINQTPATPTIFASFNLSSLTDVNVGTTNHNYTAGMVSSSHATHASSMDVSWGVKPCVYAIGAAIGNTIFYKGDLNAGADSPNASFSAMGTLA